MKECLSSVYQHYCLKPSIWIISHSTAFALMLPFVFKGSCCTRFLFINIVVSIFYDSQSCSAFKRGQCNHTRRFAWCFSLVLYHTNNVPISVHHMHIYFGSALGFCKLNFSNSKLLMFQTDNLFVSGKMTSVTNIISEDISAVRMKNPVVKLWEKSCTW